MLNQISVMGRITKKPELRMTQSEKSVCSFTIANESDVKVNGERQTTFLDVVAWNGTAEFISKYFDKGNMIIVSGRLTIRDWTDKEGNKRKSAEIIANNVYFGESKRSETPASVSYSDTVDVAEGDLPFD